MSIEVLKKAFDEIQHNNNWSLLLLKITTSKRDGTKYASRLVSIEPDTTLNNLVQEISAYYIGTGKGNLSSYSVVEYDGTLDGMTIYKINNSNALISLEYNDFVTAIADPDVEADPMAYKSAYVIKGTIVIDDEELPVKLISMQNPITTLKHKYSLFNNSGKFRELNEKVLSLRPRIDIIIIGDLIYFLTINGENLFNMERAYKTVCNTTVESIISANMVSGCDVFKTIAQQKHNPRRFVSFNNDRFLALKNTNTRKNMAKKFNIPLDIDDGFKLDARTEEAAERIIKMLCNKGMVDPFKDIPVEVSSARPW